MGERTKARGMIFTTPRSGTEVWAKLALTEYLSGVPQEDISEAFDTVMRAINYRLHGGTGDAFLDSFDAFSVRETGSYLSLKLKSKASEGFNVSVMMPMGKEVGGDCLINYQAPTEEASRLLAKVFRHCGIEGPYV